MKKHILYFCILIISLFFINLNAVSAGGSNDDAVEEAPVKEKEDDGLQATIRCEYELEYPEAYIANLFNGTYSVDDVKKICESGQNTLYPDPQACLDKFINNKVLTTVYIEGYKSGNSFIDCYRSGACKVTYISNKDSATPLDGTTAGSTVTTENMNGIKGHYILKEMKSGLDVDDIKTNPNVSMKPNDFLNASEFNGVTLEEELDAWYSKFKGNNCPNIHLYYDLNTKTVKISGQTFDNLKYHREIQNKEMYLYNPDDKDISDKPVEENQEQEPPYATCEFGVIGAGSLAGKQIDLKLRIEKGNFKDIYGEYINISFISGKNTKPFKNVAVNKLEYYPIDFNVAGIGSNINLFISEDSEDGIMIENFVNSAACLSGKEVYIYPYIYTDTQGNKVDVYKIAYSDREYEIDVGKGNSPELEKINYGKVTCATIFKDADGHYNTTHGLLKIAIKFIQYLAVILASVLSVVDFIKVVPTQDKDALKKSTMKAVTRLGLAIAIFLVPVLLKFILKLIGISDPLCGLI